ncbi:hypothetical protein BABINDRAFT_167339 [Babjeviella inositovora NRRL Y-12698]|uniref:Uncharacterized protein n=1 Tax=Babjeviella inositovora NRRL Y-12698 TaxID=984486 RepID=A0A1E3QQZ0_9ASCO|nr:uncharacterized protein BABINDRAFT_167339 [Babjeviella inositovora NRRL Y-12698]ODQ79482.1 hypothetical protein BABINDRAFT_167339 [Babjeviella inositovora NRRL Y-12698]
MAHSSRGSIYSDFSSPNIERFSVYNSEFESYEQDHLDAEKSYVEATTSLPPSPPDTLPNVATAPRALPAAATAKPSGFAASGLSTGFASGGFSSHSITLDGLSLVELLLMFNKINLRALPASAESSPESSPNSRTPTRNVLALADAPLYDVCKQILAKLVASVPPVNSSDPLTPVTDAFDFEPELRYPSPYANSSLNYFTPSLLIPQNYNVHATSTKSGVDADHNIWTNPRVPIRDISVKIDMLGEIVKFVTDFSRNVDTYYANGGLNQHLLQVASTVAYYEKLLVAYNVYELPYMLNEPRVPPASTSADDVTSLDGNDTYTLLAKMETNDSKHAHSSAETNTTELKPDASSAIAARSAGSKLKTWKFKLSRGDASDTPSLRTHKMSPSTVSETSDKTRRSSLRGSWSAVLPRPLASVTSGSRSPLIVSQTFSAPVISQPWMVVKPETQTVPQDHSPELKQRYFGLLVQLNREIQHLIDSYSIDYEDWLIENMTVALSFVLEKVLRFVCIDFVGMAVGRAFQLSRDIENFVSESAQIFMTDELGVGYIERYGLPFSPPGSDEYESTRMATDVTGTVMERLGSIMTGRLGYHLMRFSFVLSPREFSGRILGTPSGEDAIVPKYGHQRTGI